MLHVQCPIVERLACSLMRTGRNNGKKLMAVRIVKHTLELIHILTDQNPVQVFVDAIVNAGTTNNNNNNNIVVMYGMGVIISIIVCSKLFSFTRSHRRLLLCVLFY